MIKFLNNIESTFLDYPDGESSAVIVCLIGCDNHCKGCQNPDLKNYDYSTNVKTLSDEDFVNALKDYAKRERTNKIVLSGGDPLSCFNIESVKNVLKIINNELDVCIYTGHDINYVKENNVTGFKYVKCGYFNIDTKQESMKTDDFIQFATPNQELYNSEYKLLSKNGRYYFNQGV